MPSMDIFINGQVLNEPNLKLLATFSQLMSELNRFLSGREEIIVDVRADGREIISWDSIELDPARVSRLEIQSQPIREYAVGSLGDLGDYTGNTLAVLRNAEEICRKEGFPEVRRQLAEGLDYILTVIETSGKILDLKMDQSRYDMRSGTQMLNELKMIKTRLSKAHNFDAAKKDLEELEFTLTDWLKFLEILLRRYADKQADFGTPEDISGQAQKQIESLDQLSTDVKQIVEDLYAGKIAKSLDQFHGRLLSLQMSLSYLEKLREHGRINYQTLAVEQESLAAKIPKIAKVLKELSDSIQIGDTVLMRDLLEYELLPFIAFLRQIFGQLTFSPKKE